MNLDALGIVVNPRGPAEQRVPCPQCAKGGRDAALGVNVETGTFHCFRCSWSGRAGGSTTHAPVQHLDDPAVGERKRERLRQTWAETLALDHPSAYAVRRYLEARALGELLRGPPPALRAHPALVYWDGSRCMGRYPAMVATLHSADNRPVTLHATYLRQDGCAKASVPSPKKTLGVPVRGATKGGAIRLHEPRNGILGIGEGIESALSLGLMKSIPVWAAFCADNLACVVVPRNLRELHIAVDLDESGKGSEVAKRLASRVQRANQTTRCCFVTTDQPGCKDLNDELLRMVRR